MNLSFFRKRLVAIALVMAIGASCLAATSAFGRPKPGVNLRFNKDKTFKIVQFTDTQDTDNIDPRTVKLMNTVLDREKPGLVVFTGDNIRGGNTPDQVKKAIDNIARPVEERHIPWLVTFGNHDEENASLTGLHEEDMLKIYMSYPYNINKQGPKDVNGTGNMNVLIKDSKGKRPVYNIWALDSGRYAPSTINGQPSGLAGYDWIRFSQIRWYWDTSEKLEKEYNHKIPSLMFFHIPLVEFGTMWNGGAKYNVTGERNETECPGAINSGLFAALLERGDVKGVFVGHDHVNDYVGNYSGITLGYSANTGFGTYGLGGSENNRLRGARVFNLNENNPDKFETHMVFAKDLNIQ